ncbi:MAG: InlB B-repeat-containing protein [Clostridia bacterium]|nr:InlB B-repeat-containing protein [Clostridia bacterium]
MKKKLLVLLTILLAFMMVLVSCGGDEETSSGEEELDTFVVSFDLGYEGATPIEDREIEEGGRIGKLPTPARDGFTFDGWKTEDGKDVKSTTKVDEDMVLYAQWTEIPPCLHPMLESAGLTEATCTEPGVLIERCTNIMCGYTKTTTLQQPLGHKMKTEDPVAPTCKSEGYTLTHCTRKGCPYEEKTDVVAKLDYHNYSPKWILVKAQTDYAYGQEKRACVVCGSLEFRDLLPDKIDEYATLPIKQVIVDGQIYVGVNETASASATSLYRITTAANAIDGRPNTYWRADTLTNRSEYSGDVFNLKLASTFDIAVIEFTIPNYWAWKLGEDATVKYDVEVLENGEWIKVGTVSDSDVRDSLSKNAVVALELDRIYKADQIRATVTHATRYTPAMIYELQVYGKVEKFGRVPTSISALAGGKITGSYNSWVNSSHANLLDNSTQTSWCTDARRWEDYKEYNRSSHTTFWSEDYTVDNKQTISKVVVNADKLVGETIEVLVCRGYMQDKVVDKKDPTTGEVMKDSEGNPIKETIQELKNEWISLGVKEIDSSFGGSFEFIPVVKDPDGVESAGSIEDVVMLRVEVDNYGVDENKDHHTITSVVATTGEGEVNYDDLEWNERKKVYASFEFPQEQYLAYIDIVCAKDAGRVMSLQFWVEDSSYEKGGYWEEYTRIEVLETSSQTGIATFTTDVGDYHSKFRVEIVKEPAIFGAYIYDITPYTVAEVATELPKSTECLHKFAQPDPVETVAPTCRTPGYSVFKCVSCDLTWKTDSTDVKDHTWGNAIKETEGNVNYEKHMCIVSGCTASYREAVSASVGSSSVGNIEITRYYHNAPAAWTMVFDDGNYTATYEWATPELVKRHMKATAGLTDQFSSSLIAEWTEWISTGAWDVASHSLNHGDGFSDATIDEATMAKEVDEAHYKFMSYFPGQRILGFVTPNGATSDAMADYVNDLMAAGRNGGQTGSWIKNVDELKTREQWGNLSSYVSYTTTTGDDYKKAIDELVKNNYWTVECHHDLSVSKATPQFSTDINAFLVKLDYFITKGVWVASFTEGTQYIRESHRAYVNQMTTTDTSISLTVTDDLDDIMFQFPLTLKMTLPQGWTNVTVTQNGVNIPVVDPSLYKPNMAEDMACTIINGTLYFDAVPDGGEVVITKAN